MTTKRTLLLLSAAVLTVVYLGCGGSSGSDGDEGLTDEENDVRVGRDITRCGVFELPQSRVEEVEQMLDQAAGQASRAEALLRPAGSIPVQTFFHVIASGPSAAEGNVSDAQLQEQINVLNAGFAPTPFRFQIVGVTRNVNPAFVDMQIGSEVEAVAKQALRQGDARTLNVYIAAPSDGTLGYATFPWDFPSQPVLDGVVLLFETLPGGPLAPYNLGDTLVHEVGHWLGLLHTFQGECGNTGDVIGDTPAERTPAFGCPVGRNTCDGDDAPDPVNNFMDYSDDSCLLEFTPEQIQRMDDAALVFRQL